MSLLGWYAVLGVVQVTLALWVILAQPRRVLNWAVGCLLMLWAGSGLLFQMWREATTVPEHLLYARVGGVYQAPSALLIMLVIDRLLIPTPRPRWWRPLLVASAVAVPFFWVLQPNGTDWYTSLPGIVYLSADILAQTAAVILATRAANDAALSTRQRRQAALVGLAFALLLAHGGASQWGNLFWGDPWGGDYIVNGFPTFLAVQKANFTLLGTAGLVASIYALVRLPAPFPAGARAAMRASLLLTIFVGVVSYAAIVGFTIAGGRAIALSAFSLVIAVAVFRYDLAASGTEARYRLQTLAAWIMGLCVVSIVAVAAWSLLPQGTVVFVIALTAVAVPAALLITPLRRLPAWVTRRILLNPNDPQALRERVRIYAGTLRASTGPTGQPLASTLPALAALRERLGLGQRDHDLLVAMGDDQRAGGIVAYRLALVGAGSKPLSEAELRKLREDLGVTERDDALVREHIEAGSDSLSPGARFLGRYHILRPLAQGGLSQVWLAHDTRERRDVVVKHLVGLDRRDGAALLRARRDARSASLFEHPNIVAVLGVEEVGGETYLVMEYMAGGSLADRLRTEGKLPEAEVVAMADGILAALEALQRRGFVHRDVKPGNILFDSSGLAKLGDFNIAREVVSGDTIVYGGAAGPTGTFAYMSLAQARGLAVRPTFDLHGLAATLYEALAGRPLLVLEGLSYTEAIARIASQRPPAVVPNASPVLADVIRLALSRPSEKGYADAAEMRAALVTAVGTLAGSGQPQSRRPAAGRPGPIRSSAS